MEIPPLRWLDRWWWRQEAAAENGQTRLPFVAVIGPPRVGSTLMYQLLITYFDFFYFDNLQHALLRYPYLAFRLSRGLPRRRPPHFESDHGFVAGLHGPSEANFFWPLWCGMPMDEHHLSEREREQQGSQRAMLIRFFDAIARRTQLPLTNSYNAHAFYMEELADWFAHVIFVNLRRDAIDNAVSIYRARQQLRQKMTDWWSIQPAPCRNTQGIDEFDQIVGQIVETYRAVDRQRRLRPDLQVVDVDYEVLLDNPERTLRAIQSAAADCSIQLRTSGRDVPARLTRKTRATPDPIRKTFVTRFSRVPGVSSG